MLEIEYGLGKEEKEEKPKKPKDEITYEPFGKGIRKKLKNGKVWSYEVTVDFGRAEKYDEKKQQYEKKQPKQKCKNFCFGINAKPLHTSEGAA